jgi:2-methylisocitrate lyase-like PEP mutase family enzyme
MPAVAARRSLRASLASRELVIAPGVFDGISAHLVGRLGFGAGYMTGAGIAAAGFGLPDIGLVTQSEMAERARMITRVLGDIPLIADADTGYGAPLNVIRTVREFEAAGVAGLHLEDQAFPKKCGHLPAKELIDTAEFVAKLTAALAARTDPDLVIIARTDARGPLGLDAAIQRANAYALAGADVIFVEAPQGTAEIERIAAEVNAPLLINLVLGGLTPILPAQRLTELGYAIAIYPMQPIAAAATAMLADLAELADMTGLAEVARRTGRDISGLAPESPAALFNLVGLTEWSKAGDRYRPAP